jgi:hypothetical protein
MGFIVPWEDPPWWAEESGESFTLGYGPKEWCKSPVIWEEAKDGAHTYLYRDQILNGIQRIEIEYDDLDSMIDLLLALRARRNGEQPPVGLMRIGVSRAEVDEEDVWIEMRRIDLANGWPEEVVLDDRFTYAIEAHEDGRHGTSMSNYPIRDYFRKPREGMTRPVERPLVAKR